MYMYVSRFESNCVLSSTTGPTLPPLHSNLAISALSAWLSTPKAFSARAVTGPSTSLRRQTIPTCSMRCAQSPSLMAQLILVPWDQVSLISCE